MLVTLIIINVLIFYFIFIVMFDFSSLVILGKLSTPYLSCHVTAKLAEMKAKYHTLYYHKLFV